jgi:hypothetical protein
MSHLVGLDVSQKMTAICVVVNDGRGPWRGQCPSVPEHCYRQVRNPDFGSFGLIRFGSTRLQVRPGNDVVDGAPNGISVPRWSLSKPHLKGSGPRASLSGIYRLSRGLVSI